MAILRMPDVRKLSREEAGKKLEEIQRALLELTAEGRVEKAKPLRKAIARLKTYLHQLQHQKENGGSKSESKLKTKQ